MKLLISIFVTILSFGTMEAQKKETFLYELRLFEKFRKKSQWTDMEHSVQKAHVEYLDSLTKTGKIFIAGIKQQGLNDQAGLVILNVDTYEEALGIVQNDPSIKMGMMTSSIEKFNIFFMMN